MIKLYKRKIHLSYVNFMENFNFKDKHHLSIAYKWDLKGWEEVLNLFSHVAIQKILITEKA